MIEKSTDENRNVRVQYKSAFCAVKHYTTSVNYTISYIHRPDDFWEYYWRANYPCAIPIFTKAHCLDHWTQLSAIARSFTMYNTPKTQKTSLFRIYLYTSLFFCSTTVVYSMGFAMNELMVNPRWSQRYALFAYGICNIEEIYVSFFLNSSLSKVYHKCFLNTDSFSVPK